MKKICYVFILTLLTGFSQAAVAEQLQLTTYYPAPYGAYDKLILVPRTPLSGSCQTGTLYMEDVGNGDGEMRLCDKGIWAPMTGQWIQKKDDVFLIDTETNPDLFVGIGTTDPSARLSVEGYGNNATTTSLNVTNGDGSSILYARDDGNIGIGTTSPESALHVKGGGDIYTEGWSSGINFISSQPATVSTFAIKTHVPDGDQLRIRSNPNRLNGASWRDLVSITGSGNVGIGTTNPQSSLQIGGGIQFNANADWRNVEPDVHFDSSASIAAGYSLYNIINGNNTAPNSVFIIGTNSLTTGGANYRELMRVKTNGNVGIGTKYPTQKLHINSVMRLEPRNNKPFNCNKNEIGSIYYKKNKELRLCTRDGSDYKWRKLKLD